MSRWVGKYFKASEFVCHCGTCEDVGVHPILVETLDKVRAGVGVAIRVTSGVRCKSHNRSIGSTDSSLHVPRLPKLTSGVSPIACGYAADIQFADRTSRTPLHIMRLYYEAERAGAAGLGLYPSWIHVDRRDLIKRHKKRARWADPMFSWGKLF